MQNPENFRLFYNQTIQPELQRLDKHRRRLLRLLLLSALGIAGLVFVEMYISIFVVTMMMAIPIGLYIGYLWKKVRLFVQDFKPKVVKLLLDHIDDGLLFGELKYDAKGGIPMQKFMEGQLFGAVPAVYEAEDYIEGRIGDVEFEMCELKVQEFSKVRARLDHVFRGIFIRAKFIHPPRGALLVLPKNILPQLATAVKDFVAQGGICLDGFIRHEAFRQLYTVYGSRNTKPSELLPEELMDFLLRYRKKAGEICLSFVGKHIYAAIPNEKDILEPNLFQSNVSYELVREFYEDIYVALNLVIEFDKSH